MKALNLNKGVAFFGLLLLLLLTYFRENFLLEINANLALEEYNRAYSYWLSDFFTNMTPELLSKWKWGLTMFISMIMAFITMVSLYVWFKSNQVLKIIGLFYVGLFICVCLLALVGYLTNSFNDIYFILRKILGIVQSPLPFFTLFTLFYWSSKN
tara:strand:- start:2077 stop:2541 length:465 start_codon:yes stop_codon:yes gene_type:complete